jgi:actin-related protein
MAGVWSAGPRGGQAVRAVRVGGAAPRRIPLFGGPEVLFRPALAGCECASLPHFAARALARCDPALRPALAARIVLSGGTARLPGLGPRLRRELAELAGVWGGEGVAVEVVGERGGAGGAAWAGGGVVAGRAGFGGACISAAEYAEVGPVAACRKCF